MKNFQDFGLPEALLHRLQNIGFVSLTPIQNDAIPLALEGQDIIASAPTGTGKTAAFAIPAVTKIINNISKGCLVMAPTRELATQIMTQIQLLIGKKSKINTALLIGGEAIVRQFPQLKNNPKIIVGTPGRINDHIERRTIDLSNFDFLVLDETDRMLDMGFSIQIETIIKLLNPNRQTLLFSATLPNNINKIAEKYLNNPARISVGALNKISENIKQDIIKVNTEDKYPILNKQLESRDGSVIVFVATKRGTEKLAKTLKTDGHNAIAIHGDLRQNARDRIIRNFRNQKNRILVATDVAARGLDISHVDHVINFDLPQSPEDYVHRVGRTARAGKNGEALCLIAPKDNRKWQLILKLIDPEQAKQEAGSLSSRKSRSSRRRNSNPRSFSKNKANAERRSSDLSRKPKNKFGGKPSGNSTAKSSNNSDSKPRNNSGAGAKPKNNFSGKLRNNSGAKPGNNSGGKSKNNSRSNNANSNSRSSKPKRRSRSW